MATAPRLDDQLCFALYTASRLVTRAYRPLLVDLGITYPQYLTLLVLWERRDLGKMPPSVKELGARLHLDSGTLTPLLKRMATLDLVRRTRDPEDERSLRITLTDRGSALSEAAAEVPAQLLCDADADDLAALERTREAVQALIDRLA